MTTTTHTDGVSLTAAAWFNDVDTAAYAALTSVSGTNTITATGPANYALASRMPLWFIPANTNTGATTLNVTPSGSSAAGAKNVFFGGAACVGGEIVAGVPCGVIYDGTQYNLLEAAVTGTTTASTFTFDGSGGTTGSITLTYRKRGLFVTLNLPATAGTSGTGSTKLSSNTALPAAFRPAADSSVPICRMVDNGGAQTAAGLLIVRTTGVLDIFRDGAATAYTNTSSCGTLGAQAITYFIG